MATEKKTPVPPTENRPTMPLRRILFWTMGAGAVLCLGGLVARRGDFALGAGVGAILSCLGLLHVKDSLRKTLTQPENTSIAPYLVSSFLRIAVWAAVLLLLLKVSLTCMLAAALLYTLHLGILAYHGFKSAPEAKTVEMPPPMEEDR